MKKVLLGISLICITNSLFAQHISTDSTGQFMLIIRYKADVKYSDTEKLKSNGKHWETFIGDLARSGNFVTGFRPSAEGRTITGSSKTLINSAYGKADEEVSSLFIIKALSLEEAVSIAEKCPILEMDGSVEVRPIIKNAN